MKSMFFAILLAAAAPVAHADIGPGQVYLYDDRGDILIHALTNFYGLSATPAANGTLTLNVEAIDCQLDSGALTPQCTVKAGGKTFTALKLMGLSPDASVFQLLAESGAARSDAQHPGVTFASATAITCSSGGEATGCMITPTIGTPVVAKTATLGVHGYHARDLLVALEAGGSPDTSSGQYGMSTKLDTLSCTAKKVWGDSGFTMEFACAGAIAGKTFTLSGANASIIYRILAETGAAKYDAKAYGYAAVVTNLDCDFGSTHTSGGENAVCAYTTAARQQVLTHLVFDSFASNDTQDSINNSVWSDLRASGAPITQVSGASIVTVDADCQRDSYSSLTKCTAKSDSKDLPDSSRVGDLEAIFARSGGERAMPSLEGGVASYGSVTCILADANLNHVGCVVRTYRVAPL